MYGSNMKMNKGATSVSKSSSGGAGKDPMVPRKEKHPLKSSFWRQKKMKGDC